MTYMEDLAKLVDTHRHQLEADLIEARSTRSELEAGLQEADRNVAALEAILATRSSPDAQGSALAPRLTLHEAMRKVLETAPGRRMTAADIAKAIQRRGLYTMRDGRPVEAQQIHARVGHYAHLFERDGQGIVLH